MNLLARGLVDREDRAEDEAAAEDLWLRERAGIDPEERRESWRRWLRKELETRLQWPSDEAAKARLIGQSMAELTTLARQLRGRGWLLDGKALAVHVRELLEPVGKAQRAGKVGDFWPYFRAAVRTYVGAHAEEIQAHARRTAADVGTTSFADALAGLGIGKGSAPRGPSMTEIVADRGDQIEARKRAAAASERDQLRLL